MNRKRLLVLFLGISMGVLFSSPGCEVACRDGHVSLLGELFASFNMSIREIAPEGDGTYRVSFLDANRQDLIWTTLEMKNYTDVLMDILLDMVDPIIAQVPSDVTDITAGYNNNAGLSGAMTVIAGLQSISVTPAVTITPEAGHQLVIFDFPDVEGLIPGPDGEANFINVTVTAKVDPPRSIEVKAISSARATMEGTDYYLPLFPGVTDFSLVPSFTIPLDEDIQALVLPTSDDLPETPGRLVYDMSPAADDTDGADTNTDSDNSAGSGGGGGGSCFIRSSAGGR